MSNATAKQVCLVVALVALVIYIYGILVTITSIEKNDCRMTYMFEYPQFVVSSPINSLSHFFRYFREWKNNWMLNGFPFFLHKFPLKLQSQLAYLICWRHEATYSTFVTNNFGWQIKIKNIRCEISLKQVGAKPSNWWHTQREAYAMCISSNDINNIAVSLMVWSSVSLRHSLKWQCSKSY